MDTSWDDLRLFLAAAEAGSLSGAAARLGLGQATLSRRVAALEERLGTRLFQRSRAGLLPTAAAEALLPHARAMAEAARMGGAALQGAEARPEGPVRIACPPGLGADLLPPLLPALRRRHPGIQVSILTGNFTLDLLRHEADIALRGVRPPGGDLVLRRLSSVPLGVFASPAYAAGLDPGQPLEWLQWSAELAHIPMARWIAQRLAGRPPAMLSNDFLAMRAAAVAGLGAMVLPTLQGHIAGLVPLDGDWPPLPEAPLYLVVPGALRRVPRVAAVVDFIAEVAAGDLGALTAWPPPGWEG